MVRRLTKKQTAKLRKRAHDLLTSLGAEQTEETSWPEYRMETPFGLWKVYVFEDWIATRFDDPNKAKTRIRCNPFSGKWNFLGFDLELDEFLDNFEREVRKMLAFEPEAA